MFFDKKKSCFLIKTSQINNYKLDKLRVATGVVLNNLDKCKIMTLDCKCTVHDIWTLKFTFHF